MTLTTAAAEARALSLETGDEHDLALTSTVAEARRHLDEAASGAAIVMDGGMPAGVITRAALDGRPGRRPRPEALLTDVMDVECVRSDPGADATQTLRSYSVAAAESLRRRRPCADDIVTRRDASFDDRS